MTTVRGDDGPFFAPEFVARLNADHEAEQRILSRLREKAIRLEMDGLVQCCGWTLKGRQCANLVELATAGTDYPTPSADRMPMPLCTKHREELRRWRQGILEEHQVMLREAALLRDREKEERCCVYFLRRADGMVKIGYSSNVKSRIATLARQHGSLELLGLRRGGRQVEAELHERWSKQRLWPTEWFRPTPRLLRYAEGCRIAIESSRAW